MMMKPCRNNPCWLGALGVVVLLLAGAAAFARQAQNAPPQKDGGKRQPVEPDRVGDLLKSIDPKMLNLSGADLEMELVGDQLFLRGNEADLDVVELLIAMLEQAVGQKEMRIVTVTEKDANEIARTLEPALQSQFDEPNQREELKLTITALSSNVILVSALPEHIDFIVDLIAQVDEVKADLPPMDRLVFPIKHRKASDVAVQLTDIITVIQEKGGRTGPQYKIQIIPNNANNSIMVLAPAKDREKIQSLLDEIDVEPAKGWGEVKLTLFPLLHSKASEMQSVITELLGSQTDREAAEEVIYRLLISKALPSGEIIDLPPIDLQKPTRIIADEGTNSLIVATVEENIVPMGELIRLMDGVPMAEEVTLKLYPLRFADAQTVADLINQLVDGGSELTQDPDGAGTNAVPPGALGKALVYSVGIYADVRTNVLIVTGRSEHLELIDQVIADLDQPSNALRFPLRFITMAHTDATQVGSIVTELFEGRISALEAMEAGRMAVERERVFLSIDIRSNSLIVSCSDENFTEITTIARKLDNKPAALFDQIRIVRCERLDADNMKQKIEDLWQRKAELRREEDLLMDLPIVVVDERSNSLIIASSQEDFEEIKRLIGRLEAQPLIDDIRLFKLEFADAAVLASMLDGLFSGLAGASESLTAPTILPDPRSNALVAAGSRDALERVADLVERLDVKAGPMTAIFKVYSLEHASAARLGERMQELFDSRSEGTEISRTPIVILPDEASNSLVTSASRDDHQEIVGLLKLLDKPSSLARQFTIFPLKMASATTVVEKLDTLFQSQGSGATGRMDAIATEADERTNSIIVWASPSQMVNIGEVISRLDTSTPVVEMMVKVIQLKQALAADFADLLRTALLGGDGDDEQAVILSFVKKHDDGTETVHKLLRQNITLEADPRTNSLMVMAPPASMDMLETMIRDFDAIRPIRSELRLFPLMNADAEAMADQLSEVFQTNEGGGDTEARARLVFGDTIGDFEVASVGQDLRFAADPRTNTLIAAGAEVDLRMAESLIQYLDSQAAETRVQEVYRVNYLSADEIANAIQGFNSQEQDVLGEAGDDEATARRMERQVSIEAVGDEDEGSSSIIVGMSRRMYQDTMRMIRELDRPEPQVRISVVIAEITLTDDFEFGIEFAGQELDFTRGAVTGPNGVIQGSDFDFVAGTVLGAAGSGLGFNFTITGEDFSFLFRALQQSSRLEILSRPTIVIRNGEEGNITIADQVPFVQSSQINDTGSTNSVIGREDVGIVLTATPHISPDGFVTVELQQEISSFAGENLQLTEGVTSPIFSTREVTTNITLRDGETVVIGGLITTRRSEGRSQIPLLGDLPLIGPLFRVDSVSEQRTELLIIMTVDVLRTAEDTWRMSLAERDNLSMPDSILKSPLLEGLRILPDESLLGPTGPEGGARGKPAPVPEKSELYGPKPKTYGPPVPRRRSTSTAQRAVFGPRVARNEGPMEEPGE